MRERSLKTREGRGTRDDRDEGRGLQFCDEVAEVFMSKGSYEELMFVSPAWDNGKGVPSPRFSEPRIGASSIDPNDPKI